MIREGLIKIRVFFLKRKISSKNAVVTLEKPSLKVKIIKEAGATFLLNGTLGFYSFMGEIAPTRIYLKRNSTLQIDGDFNIGPGVNIMVDEGGFLRIGGKNQNTPGITCNSRIMVLKHVEIGKDSGCAWNVFITDSNWHHVEFGGQAVPMQQDVVIGDHVWICPDCSILKGTKIGGGCVVGTKSLLSNQTFPENSLIAGIPAKVIKQNCCWKQALS